MSQSSHVKVDLLILGGGIAGCWTLAAATEAGFNCLLLEKDALGSGQSIASQGIIHGGLKYALGAKITASTQAISTMPTRWQASLQGNTLPNLSDVNTLSGAHYFIPTGSLESKLVSFLGSKMVKSFASQVKTADLPKDYQSITKAKKLYALHESVIETGSLFQSLLNQYGHLMVKHEFKPERLTQTSEGFLYEHGDLKITTSQVLSTLGNGTPSFTQNLQAMQQRPLQMVMAKGDLPYIYGHFIDRGITPALTLTSHPHNGQTVWYLGGELAESGVNLTKEEQISHSKALLKSLVPHLNVEALIWDTLRINRAETALQTGARPDDVFVSEQNGLMIGFPTKLALAPRFAEAVLSKLKLPSSLKPPTAFSPLEKPAVAPYPWSHL